MTFYFSFFFFSNGHKINNINLNIRIDNFDVDLLKNTHSRVDVGTSISRFQLLYIALMASDNRAASALARTFSGGKHNFVTQMNETAAKLHMTTTVFYDSSGLNYRNKSSVMDVDILMTTAMKYADIQLITSTPFSIFDTARRKKFTTFNNTNKNVGVNSCINGSKTGHINEVGYNIVVQYKRGYDFINVIILGAKTKKQRSSDLKKAEKIMGIDVCNISPN